MENWVHLLTDFGIILILIVGISRFRTPRGARFGNATAAFALLCALVAVAYRNPLMALTLVFSVATLSAAVGWFVAMRVKMIQIPAMVAFQHGAGGIAAFLISFVELTRTSHETLSLLGEGAGILGLVLGAATFSGSMIASGKLANRLRQTPTVLQHHNSVLLVIAAGLAALALLAGWSDSRTVVVGALVALVLVSILLGIVFSIRIGGADMPVLISFLNATAGFAAALCGLLIENRLLIACGATVAASGSILTHVMCVGMNRSLIGVFTGIQPQVKPPGTPAGQAPAVGDDTAHASTSAAADVCVPQEAVQDPIAQVVAVAKSAKRVIVIPGYGMALAEAQFDVVKLGETLTALGADVKFAVHPVAGRMPGHMHVLLAEAEVDYDQLFELDDINKDFSDTDLALVVGACDVVNTAAIDTADTPISGMPILCAHEARHIAVCNLDEKPGYSGVENPLYTNPKTILLFGDAKESIRRILAGLAPETEPLAAPTI